MPSYTLFRPRNSFGTLLGAVVTVFCLLVGLGLLLRGLTGEAGLEKLAPLAGGPLFLGLAALGGYWTWGCYSLSYVVDRNALTLRWAGLRQVIPLTSIERLVPGQEGDDPRVSGVDWPGHHVGRAELPDFGEVLFYSAHRDAADILYVQTPAVTYAISVPDQVFFAQTIQSNQERGPLSEPRQALHRWGISSQSFWQDPLALALSGALVAAFVALLAYVLQIYPGLAETLQLRFPSLEGIIRLRDKEALLDIPRSGAGLVAVNLLIGFVVHSWERMLTYVLLVAGIGVQVMLLVAAIVAVA
jgi:hypothetical protein